MTHPEPVPQPWWGSDVAKCGDGHPRLASDNVCTEPAGHPGPHVTTDECGRPEYTWRRR